MKRIISSLIILAGISASALAQADKFSFCKSYCGKQWTLVSVEEFGVEENPAENMRKDHVMFSEDGKVKITLLGKTTEGKWVIDHSQTYITITDEKTKVRTSLKTIKNDHPEMMMLEYQDPISLVRTKMVYEKK
jgi:hypothetical protein